MIVLALDTTTVRGSCALARATAEAITVTLGEPGAGAAGVTADATTRLPRALMTLLDRERCRLDEVDAFAVATGPGGFTGLRVGIATMQGLAFATRRPLVGVSTFDALAMLAGDAPRVACWVDAWRGDVFTAVYEGGAEMEEPAVIAPDAALARLAGRSVAFIGDGAVRHAALIRTALGTLATFAEPADPPLAGAIGRLAARAVRDGHRPAPHAIQPLYVRRSGAELARDARGL